MESDQTPLESVHNETSDVVEVPVEAHTTVRSGENQEIKNEALSDLGNSDDLKAPYKIFGKATPISKELFNAIWLGFSFFLIIVSFLAAQNIQSQLNAELGNYSLGLLYTGLSITSILCIPLIEKLGEKIAFAIGAFCYVLFICANVEIVPAFFLLAGFINGVGGSILWVAQGVYITKISNDQNREKFSSIFVAFLASSHIIANGITAITQQFPSFSFETFFVFFTIVCATSLPAILLLRPAPKPKNSNEEKTSTLQMFVQLAQLTIDRKTLILYPMILGYGFNISFIFGAFPAKINDTHWSSIALTFFGLFYLFISLVSPRMKPLLGGNMLMLVSVSGTLAGIIGTSIIPTTAPKAWFIIPGIFFGAMEPCLLVQMFAIFGEDFSTRLSQINSVFRFLSAAAGAFLFLVTPHLSYATLASLTFGMNALGFVFFLVRFVIRRRNPVVTRPSSQSLIPDQENPQN